MAATLAYAGKNRTLAIVWGSGTVETMPTAKAPLDTRSRARNAGTERMRKMPDPEDRGDFARKGAAAAHRPATLARRIAKAWVTLSEDERSEVREILRQAGVTA